MCPGNPNWPRPAPNHLHHDGIRTKGGLLLLRGLRARRHRHALLDRCAQEQLKEEKEEEEEAEQLQEGGGGIESLVTNFSTCFYELNTTVIFGCMTLFYKR